MNNQTSLSTRKLAKFTSGAFVLASLIFNIACNKSSGDGGGSSAATASSETLTMSPNPASVATGSTVLLTPGGGTGPYQFVVVSSGGGSVSQASGSFTVFTAPTNSGIAEIQVTDAVGASAYFPVTITGSSTTVNSTLAISPLNTSVVAGGAVAFTVSGGTPPYYFTAGGGSFSPASSTTGSTFYAPTSAAVVTVQISDSAGAATQTTVNVTASTTTTTPPATVLSCEGNYNFNLDGYAGTMYVIEDGVGNIAGAFSIEGSSASFYGTCANGTISFINTYSSTHYTGTYYQSGNTVVMSGSTSTGINWSAQTY